MNSIVTLTKKSAFPFAISLLAVVICQFFLSVSGQTKQGTVERIKVHGKSLEGKLSGDAPDRDVSIYLPRETIGFIWAKS